MFFIGCIISFVASCDHYLRQRADFVTWKSRPRHHRSQVKLTVAIYFLALLFTVLAADVDSLMFWYHKQNPQWYATAMNDAQFLEKYERWTALSYLRMSACMAAWLLISLDLRRQLASGDTAEREKLLLYDQLDQVSERLAQTRGQQLKLLSPQEMSLLVAEQREALAETERVLTHRLRSVKTSAKKTTAKSPPSTPTHGHYSGTKHPGEDPDDRQPLLG